MTSLNHRILSVAAVLLLTASSSFAQSVNAPQPQQKNYSTQAAGTTAPQKYAVTAEVMQNYTPPVYMLPWAPLPMSDIQVRTRVWRTIDITEAQNKVFSSTGTATQSLINILMEGVFQGKMKAYDAVANDRFTKELSKADLIALFTPGSGGKGYNLATVVKYRIKEDWLQLKDKGTMEVRIIGLAPVVEVKGADGQVTEQPLFWLYYPDNRAYLAQQPVSGSAGVANWDQLFEARNFQSKVIKTASPIWQEPVAARQ